MPLVSVCAIVRDEAANLPALFASAEGLLASWHLVDTGSRDGTPDVARSLGAEVVHRPWRDDFAWARNESLKLATGSWVVVLDGDDRLHGAADLRELLASDPPVDALSLLVESRTHGGDGSSSIERLLQPRVFRRSAGVRYCYPVHAVPVLDGLRQALGPGRIEHLGYEAPGSAQRRTERARRILGKLAPDDPHRLLHEVRAAAAIQDWPAVIEAAERFAATAPPVPADAAAQWALALALSGQPGRALAVVGEAVQRHPHAIDLYYVGLLASGFGHLACGQRARARKQFPGVATSFEDIPAVARALVELGAVDEALLRSDLAQPPFAPAVNSAGEEPPSP